MVVFLSVFVGGILEVYWLLYIDFLNPSTLLKLSFLSRSSLVGVLGSLMYNNILSKNWNVLTSFPIYFVLLKYFQCFSTMQKHMNAIWIMRGFMNLKEQRQLHYKLTCQKDTKAGRYKDRQISEFKGSLEHTESRSRHGGNGNFRTGSHLLPYHLINKGRQISELFCNVKRNVCLLSPKN